MMDTTDNYHGELLLIIAFSYLDQFDIPQLLTNFAWKMFQNLHIENSFPDLTVNCPKVFFENEKFPWNHLLTKTI